MSLLYDIQPAPSAHLEGARLTSLPILLLNVHSQCNCRCVMCDIWKRKDGSECHAADLERHRESIKKLDIKHVVLSGGEPLLSRELDAICTFFRELGLHITLLTTGLLLQKKAALVAAGFDDIIISIDGPPEVHDRIRRIPRAFQTIQRGVLAVREIRPEMPISCRTTVQKLNYAHLRATVCAAKSLNLDSISFLPADTSSAAFNREERWVPERQDEITLNRAELVELEKEIELMIKTYQTDIDRHFIAENGAKLRRIGMRFRERIEGIPPRSPICNAPWVSAVMEVDGTIRPCFFHPSIGNAHQLTLEEVINSEAGLSFRSRLNVAGNPTCQRCVCSLNYPR